MTRPAREHEHSAKTLSVCTELKKMAMVMQKAKLYVFPGFLTRLEIKVERERQAPALDVK